MADAYSTVQYSTHVSERGHVWYEENKREREEKEREGEREWHEETWTRRGGTQCAVTNDLTNELANEITQEATNERTNRCE